VVLELLLEPETGAAVLVLEFTVVALTLRPWCLL